MRTINLSELEKFLTEVIDPSELAACLKDSTIDLLNYAYHESLKDDPIHPMSNLPNTVFIINLLADTLKRSAVKSCQ